MLTEPPLHSPKREFHFPPWLFLCLLSRQLGRELWRRGLHPHGEEPREPLRDRQLRLLPRHLAGPRASEGVPRLRPDPDAALAWTDRSPVLRATSCRQTRLCCGLGGGPRRGKRVGYDLQAPGDFFLGKKLGFFRVKLRYLPLCWGSSAVRADTALSSPHSAGSCYAGADAVPPPRDAGEVAAVLRKIKDGFRCPDATPARKEQGFHVQPPAGTAGCPALLSPWTCWRPRRRVGLGGRTHPKAACCVGVGTHLLWRCSSPLDVVLGSSG